MRRHIILAPCTVMLPGQAVQLAVQKADWKVGIRTQTFHSLTLMETLDKTQQPDMGYTETPFLQELGAPFPKEAYLNYDLSDDNCALLRREFKIRGTKPIAFSIVFYGTNKEWDKFFTLTHRVGAHIVTVEPKLNQLDYTESLAKKYDTEVMVHNHPSLRIYASTEAVEKALKGRSPLMGAYVDIGYQKRVDEDPLGNLQKSSGHIRIVYLKDLIDETEGATWGTGILPVEAFVNELKCQHFGGLVSIEYDDFKSNAREIHSSLELLQKCPK